MSGAGDRVRLDLMVLLPEIPDERDDCVRRLRTIVSLKEGITRAHVTLEADSAAALCVHYDPAVVSVAEIERAAERAGARIGERFGHASLPIRAVDAEDAARRIESGLRAVEGVLSASANVAAQRVGVEFDRRVIDVEEIEERLRAMGYGPRSEESSSRLSVGAPVAWLRKNAELALSLGAGLLLTVGWAGERWLGLPGGAAILLYALAYLAGAWDILGHLLKQAREGRAGFDIDLLMLVAAIGAAVLGEWAEGAFLLFLFSLAHALEHLALDRARGAIRALGELAPRSARVLRDGEIRDVPVEEVEPGAWVIVRPSERIPVDGTVRKGRSAVDQAPITGESVPVEKDEGDEVFAGTVNGEGALQVETTRAAGDRTLDRVIELVEEAQTKKAPTERFTDRFERVFVPIVLVAAVLIAVVGPMTGVWSWSTAFYRSMALLVAASPCALAIGTPSAVLAGIAQAARNGVLIKGGVYIEKLGGVTALAMDKTGTLTVGRPDVTDVEPAEGVEGDELLRISAAVERSSQHPLAEAVVRRAEKKGLTLPEAGDLESVTARGVRSSVDGVGVEIGNLRLWEDEGIAVPDEIRQTMERLEKAGRSVMAVRHGERWLGVLGVSDQPRSDASAVIQRIRDLGIETMIMITGDNEGVARAIADEVGLDDVRADLLPEDKVDAVQELLERHGDVAMIGDGVNDAPALAAATVGIAMGGAGTAAALETADVALMGDQLSGIPFVIGLSRRTRRVIQQNLAISLGVIGLLVVATTTGVFGIGPAVLVHEGSTLLVVGNALRLLGYEPAGRRVPHR